MSKNTARNTFYTASAMRNPVSTGAAFTAVGTTSIFVAFVKGIFVISYLMVKWTLILGWYLAVAGWKGAAALYALIRRSVIQYRVGRGSLTASQAAEITARPAMKPGVWYPEVGVYQGTNK